MIKVNGIEYDNPVEAIEYLRTINHPVTVTIRWKSK